MCISWSNKLPGYRVKLAQGSLKGNFKMKKKNNKKNKKTTKKKEVKIDF